MLEQVILQTAIPMVLDVEAVDPDALIVIESISGLSPADVTLFTGDFSRDGGYYQGRRVGRRNPVFTLKFNPDYENDIMVSDIREGLYRQFLEPQAAADGVRVLLKDDRRPDRYFVGYTEKFESEIFSNDPRGQISLICVDPFIKSDVAVSGSDSGLASLPLTYDGSADTGISLTVKVTTATSSLVIESASPSFTPPAGVTPLIQTMTLNGSFAVNDVIEINTVIGSRSIKKNGVDIMAALTAASQWIMIKSKDSVVRVNGSKGVITNWGYRSAWWGI